VLCVWLGEFSGGDSYYEDRIVNGSLVVVCCVVCVEFSGWDLV